MDDTDATAPMPSADAFAGLIGRLRLTQRELRGLLSVPGDARSVIPDLTQDVPRVISVTAALGAALALVEDDDLVGRWLRAPLTRRGGSTPLEEVEQVDGDTLIRFVLRPDPTELVMLVTEDAGRPTSIPRRRMQRCQADA